MRRPAFEPLYPAADRYVEAFGDAQLRHWLARRNIGGARLPLFVRFLTQHPPGQYTPNASAGRTNPVRKTLAPSDDLAREIGLVGGLLQPSDRRLFEASLGGAAQTWPSDVIGVGPGAFGRVGPACYQNHERLEDYRAALDAGRLPVRHGLELTPDDLARRAIIESLARLSRVSIESIEIAHVIDFRRAFAAELADLARLAREGLVELGDDWIVVTATGRARIAELCAVFDRYLRTEREHASYARVL